MSPDLQANTVLDASALHLDPLPLDPSDVDSGSPTASLGELLEVAGVGIGIWELTSGVVTDTETDEVFIVLSGRAVVELLDEGRELHLAPGTVGRLAAGSRTRWTVTETLRKVYITTTEADAGVTS